METEHISNQGRLEIASLPRIVRDLWRAKATGNLHLWNRDATKRLVFKDGHIVFAGTNVEKEKLGERLVQAGKIDRSVLELSFRVMERSDERFGKTIVEMGWVSPMEMQRYVATQIKDIIYSVFTWNEGDYRFEAVDDPVPAELILELHTAEVIYEGACRVINIAAIRAGIGSLGNGLKLADGQRLSIPVTREDGFILSRVKECTSIGDVVSTSPLGEEESLRRIYALVLAGVLDIEELGERERRPSTEADETRDMTDEERRFRDSLAARHSALELGDFYDRLGVDFGASGKRVREAYDEVMASLEPEAHFSAYLGNVKERLSKVRLKVREAYEVLSVPESRRLYDRRPEGLAVGFTGSETIAALTLDPRSQPVAVKSGTDADEAEIVFLEAKRLHNGGDYFDAIGALTRAVQLEPTNGSYHRLLAQWLVVTRNACGSMQDLAYFPMGRVLYSASDPIVEPHAFV